MSATGLYSRQFCDIVPGKGVRIHIEVFTEKWEDAVNQVFEAARSIKEEYERMRESYADPFAPRGKLVQVAIDEVPTTITEKFG